MGRAVVFASQLLRVGPAYFFISWGSGLVMIGFSVHGIWYYACDIHRKESLKPNVECLDRPLPTQIQHLSRYS